MGQGPDACLAGVVPGGLAVAVEGAVDALVLAGGLKVAAMLSVDDEGSIWNTIASPMNATYLP